MKNLIENTYNIITKLFSPIIAGCAIFAYLNQNLISFIPAYKSYQVGFSSFVGLIVAGLALRFREDVVGVILLLTCPVAFIAMAGSMFEDAATLASAHERRCQKIEAEMLAIKPRRSDLPDLFSALECRPQTEQLPAYPTNSVHFKSK